MRFAQEESALQPGRPLSLDNGGHMLTGPGGHGEAQEHERIGAQIAELKAHALGDRDPPISRSIHREL